VLHNYGLVLAPANSGTEIGLHLDS
jgi:hypothetical protein